MRAVFICLLFIYCSNFKAYAQNENKINWITFSQLNDSLKVKPKKVFIDFYADWCSVCKEMDFTTFQSAAVIKQLNKAYYSVKMNVEHKYPILFGNQTYVNKRKNKVNPVHEIALLMASRKNKPFALPAYVFLDENFVAIERYFQYLDEVTFLAILEKTAKNKFLRIKDM